MTTAIWWIRRDLRLGDNRALTQALHHAGDILPVFIIDPALWESPYVGEKRIAFMLGGLRALDRDLQQRGGRLIVRHGDPVQELQRLLDESGAEAIYAEADVSPYARRRDERAVTSLPLQLVDGLAANPPGSVRKDDGTPYTVFTPFMRAWKRHGYDADSLPAPERINTPENAASLPIPDVPALPESVPFVPGEAAAQQRLAAFVKGQNAPVNTYGEARNMLDLDGTSGLSPYLRWGMISLRQAVNAAYDALDSAGGKQARKNIEPWLNELIWREFYLHILWHFPQVRGQSFRPEYDRIQWANNTDHFAAWCAGRTGYPVVDAAMRQLIHTGWMHNRARMITASFLTKDLLIDWRWGERWFMQHLVDGDPAPNNGGWQWSAGTGTDAAPYFRVFNPVLQSKKFDAEGRYLRRWLPELANVPDKYVHAPWEMPAAVQRESGCVIGQDYPAPIVNHQEARERTLAAYAAAKDSPTKA